MRRHALPGLAGVALAVLMAAPATADVPSAENRLRDACLKAWRGDATACSCLIAGLRRNVSSGDYEMYLDMALVGFGVGATNGFTPMPADLRNRYRLTPDAAASAQARLSATLNQVQRHCVPR